MAELERQMIDSALTLPVRSRWARLWDNAEAFWLQFRKNRLAVVGAVIVFSFAFIAVCAPWIVPHDPLDGNLLQGKLPPAWTAEGTWSHPLGTDELGRDLLSRIVYGSRVSLLIGLIVVAFSTTIGIVTGLVSGYLGGVWDALLQRLVDVLLAFPYLILAIGLASVLEPGLSTLLIALAYKEWVYPCRVVRGEVLAAKSREYVEAARATGATGAHILFREILPNVVSSAVVVSTLRVAWVILMEASLSFLGLGVQPPTPAWGTMISTGRESIFNAWWISTFPGIAILLVVIGINLLGEGLRDALDPRLKG